MVSSTSAKVLLIHITGRDTAGLTHCMTQLLAHYEVRVLDIGQAVIHDAIALGILVEMSEPVRSSPLLTDILLKAHELNLQVHFSAIEAADYEQWVAAQGRRRYIVTMLSRTISAQHLAEVSAAVTTHGLNVDRIDRLSGRSPLATAETGRACVEFTVTGDAIDESRMRAELAAITQRHTVDIAFQHDSIFRRNRRLVAFDMDSTLIQAEVIDELAKEAGVGEQVARITESAMRGELDFQASFRHRVALLRGLRAETLDTVAARIPLTDGAERLIAMLKRLSYKTAILSGGFTFIGRKLQARLGIDHLHANELEIVDGKVTGEVKCEIVDGKRKASLLKEIAEKEGLNLEQVIAVGDGANDLPMLHLAGLGIAFNAKPIVRASARQAISTLGLDGILYLIGVRDREAEPA